MGFRKRKTYSLCLIFEFPINNLQFIGHFGNDLMNLEAYLERLASTKQDPDVKKITAIASGRATYSVRHRYFIRYRLECKYLDFSSESSCDSFVHAGSPVQAGHDSCTDFVF